MKIAIPVENGCLNSHFGGSSQFALVEVNLETKSVVSVETLGAPEHQPGVFPRWIQGLGAELVIASGIGQHALSLFSQQGIKVVSGAANTPVRKLVEDYLEGLLFTRPQGCAHHEHDHSHVQGGGSCHRPV